MVATATSSACGPRSDSDGVDDLGGFGVEDPSSEESEPSGA